MKQIIWGTAPAIVEVEIPDDTPEEERVELAIEIFESDPRAYKVISNELAEKWAVCDPKDFVPNND